VKHILSRDTNIVSKLL